MRFYAGAPLTIRDGFGLGALCVLGTEPRTATTAEMAALDDLAKMVMSQIELQHAFGRIDPLAELLKQMSCDEGQGYSFARPMELASFEQWLDRQEDARAAAKKIKADMLIRYQRLACRKGRDIRDVRNSARSRHVVRTAIRFGMLPTGKGGSVRIHTFIRSYDWIT